MTVIPVARLFGGVQEWSRSLAVATAAGLFLGLIGPFGSFLNGSRLTVLAYWMAGLWLGALIFGLTVRPAMRAAPTQRLPRMAVYVGSVLAAAAALSLACRQLATGIWPELGGRIGPLEWYGQTLVIAAPLAAGYAQLSGMFGKAKPEPIAAPAPAAGSPHALLARLPTHLGRDLLALQMEDHYVRAHTARGSTLLHIPLHRALDELQGIPGMRVHRSWWVADRAVIGAVEDARNVRLVLANGVHAPVARSRVGAARSAGLLDRRSRS